MITFDVSNECIEMDCSFYDDAEEADKTAESECPVGPEIDELLGQNQSLVVRLIKSGEEIAKASCDRP